MHESLTTIIAVKMIAYSHEIHMPLKCTLQYSTSTGKYYIPEIKLLHRKLLHMTCLPKLAHAALKCFDDPLVILSCSDSH